MSASCILDPYGRPAASPAGLYRTPSSNPNSSRTKPRLRPRSFENVTPTQRRDLINWCWGIYGKITNVGAALDFKSDFACSDGCFVEYYGANKQWGDVMMPYLNQVYYPNCNLAGDNHDFHNTLWAVSIALETHGQVGWVFDSASGRIKIISANSIGNGMSPDSKSGAVYDLGKADSSLSYWGLSCLNTGGYASYFVIEKGPFAGNFLIDGIIVDRRMVTLGYRLIGFDEDGNAGYADLPVGVMNLVYEPKFTDQIMGYPGLADLVEAVGTVDDWNYYIGQAMKLSAAFAVTRKSKDGRPTTAGVSYTTVDDTDAAGAATTRVVAHEIVSAGLVELATDNNEEIGSVPFDRPSLNEEAFIERIETGFFAKHWPREFIYTKGFGRASARIGVVQAKQKVWKRHRTLARFGVAWLRRKIAHAMAKGEIPKNNALTDPYLIGLSTPAEISVDEGNDAKIDLANLGRGVTSHRVICAKYGQNEERIESENLAKRRRLMIQAKELAAHPDNLGADGKPIWNAKEILVTLDNLGNSNIPMDLGEPVPAEEPSGNPANAQSPEPKARP